MTQTLGPGQRRADRVSTFGIGEAVDRLRAEFPDVSISSIRFLEREGLLGPKRSAGGHRQFTEEDLDRIRLIKRQQLQHRSLAEIRALLERRDKLGATEELRDQFIALVRQGCPRESAELVDEIGKVGVPLRTICLDILGPALVRIGDLWQEGALDIAEEHEASAIVRDLLSGLRAYLPPLQPDGRVALAVCAAEERHDIGLRMVAALLEQDGWTVHFLGADTPLESAIKVLHERKPEVVLVSVGDARERPYIEQLQQAIARLPHGQRPRLVVGGRAGVAAATGLNVDFVADRAESLLTWLAAHRSRSPHR